MVVASEGVHFAGRHEISLTDLERYESTAAYFEYGINIVGAWVEETGNHREHGGLLITDGNGIFIDHAPFVLSSVGRSVGRSAKWQSH